MVSGKENMDTNGGLEQLRIMFANEAGLDFQQTIPVGQENLSGNNCPG
jgi:hypothetical protein